MKIKRKTLICLILATLFILTVVSGSSFATTVSIQPAALNQNFSGFFDVFVDVTDVIDLYAFQFGINFDPTLISATGITEGSFLPNGGTTFFIPGTIDNKTGSVSFPADSLIGAISGVTGTGHLATLSLQAIGVGTSPISLSNVLLLDSKLSSIPFNSSDGSVTVEAAVPEPATMLLLGFGLVGLAGVRRKFKR